jgi:small subunit ribosomal protein S21
MPRVIAKQYDSPEFLLKKFSRVCEKSGVLAEVRRREEYEKPSEKRKRKLSEAKKRWKKRQKHVSD